MSQDVSQSCMIAVRRIALLISLSLSIDMAHAVQVKWVSLDRRRKSPHSIRCSVLAAAANNNICNVGVAYNARIGGKKRRESRDPIRMDLGFRDSAVGRRSDRSRRIDGVEFSSRSDRYLLR